MTINTLIYYFLIINTLSFLIFGFDKYKAIKSKQRISEKNLHTISFFGGFIGGIFAMSFFRHKIKKLKFILIEISILIFWIVIFYFYITNEI
jgi:uncharacterized membrane protein YsdA (DUF1294 family)